ncbi:MAG: hypothetical protein ACI9J2_000784 [Saprospiraceae bacterium]|jgi:hypothetical protein
MLLPTLGVKKHRLLLVIPLSYAYYVLIASITKLQSLPLMQAYYLYFGGLIVICSFGIIASRIRPSSRNYYSIGVNRQWLLGLGIVMISYLLYRLWAGPYIEMPSDLYNHLGFAQHQYGRIEAGFLGSSTDLKHLFNQSPAVWYTFYSLISYLVGVPLVNSLASAMLLNGLVFLSLSYAFAWFIFEKLNFTQGERLVASLLSTLFLFAHLGINIFSYVRYYALAPTMLNFAFYYGAIVLVYRLISASSNRFRDGLLLLGFTICAAIIHNQEALYIAVMGGFILAWNVFLKPFTYKAQSSDSSVLSRWWLGVSKIQLALLIVLILGFLAVVIFTYLNTLRPTDLANKVLQLSEHGPILNRVLFLNPEYQFARVITLWGGFIYLLFMVFYKKLIGNPYLFMGMLVPLFTVFNPVFVDWFLRVDGAHTLWRMLYIVPLNMVAGACVLYCFSWLRDERVHFKLAAAMSLFLMVALLFPFSFSGLSNLYSRVTLEPVQQESAYTHWSDLLQFLREETGKKSILTDPITGYAISALTHHQTYNSKFSAMHLYARNRYSFDDYSDDPLERFKGSWLVINERDGAYSETGRAARHWPADVMKVSVYYTAALKSHLEANPERYNKIWKADKISVYSIEN